MPNSMTGYGKGEAANSEGKLIIHIRSLNHRALDIIIRSTQQFLPYEVRIKRMIQERLARGRLEVFLNWEENVDSSLLWDLEQAKLYHQNLKKLQDLLELDGKISLHDILHGEKNFHKNGHNGHSHVDYDWWELIGPALHDALESLVETRKREGDRLYQDILDRLEIMKITKEKLADLRQPTKTIYRKRISERIAEFNGELDETRLALEIALLIEKSDYTEELIRLNSHHEEIGNLKTGEGSIGKRLDFISQELKREINTIGSKALSPELSRLVIDYKDELEKIREQVQNIE